MDSNSDDEKDRQSDQQFENKKVSKKASKSKDKKPGKGKAAKKPKDKDKDKKQPKQPKKKKPSKSKDKGGNIQKDTQTVRQYLEKQNRPYNLLNIFDNLHGSIKKPSLQTILDSLVSSQFLTCKQFGKNKVYFLNQSKFQVNSEIIQKLSLELTQSRQQNSQLQSRHKSLIEEQRKLLSMKTEQQLRKEIEQCGLDIQKLKKKKQKLTSDCETKIDQELVIKAEKEQEKLKKQLQKYRRVKKEALLTWSQILQKKPNEVAEIMGLD